MAINQIPSLRTWVDGQAFSARDYIYERNLAVNKINELVATVNSLAPDLPIDTALLDARYYQKYIVDANFNSDRTRITALEDLTDQAVLETSNVTFNSIEVTQNLSTNSLLSNTIQTNQISSSIINAENLNVSEGLTVPTHGNVSTALTNRVTTDLRNYTSTTVGQGFGSNQRLYVDDNTTPSVITMDALRTYIAQDFASFGFVLAQPDQNNEPDIPLTERVDNKIYLIPNINPEGLTDSYAEYLWIGNLWEFIGTTEVNLENYYQKSQIDALLGNQGDTQQTFYVAPNGDDNNPGTQWLPFATVKHACAAAAALPPASIGPFGPVRQLISIKIESGIYYEQLPIVVPSNVALVGTDLRTCRIYPAEGLSDDGVTPNNESQMFQMSAGTLAINLALYGMGGWVKPTDIQEPETVPAKGVGFALNPASPIFGASPYILDCSAFFPNGVGAYVDGDVHVAPGGVVLGNRSMLFYAYTNIDDEGVGFWADNGGVIESVSNFTYYAAYGYLATRGGYIRGLNGSNSWGTWALFAKGFLPSEVPLTATLKGTILEYSDLVTEFAVGETITGATSGAVATILNIQSGTATLYIDRTSTEEFINGEVITSALGEANVLGSERGQNGPLLLVTGLDAEPEIRQSVSIAGDDFTYVIASISGTYVDNTSVLALVLSTNKTDSSPAGTAVEIRKRYSQIRVTGHDFLNVGTGGIASITIGGGTLINPGSPPVESQQVGEFDTGRVFSVSTDQDGNFRVGKFFAIDQGTGRATLDASAFDLSGLTSLRLGSIGAQLGEAINEFSSDPTLGQNSNEKVPTQAAVRTYVASQIDNTLAGDVVVGGNLTAEANLIVDGNLTVNGATTTINSTTITVDDKNIVLGDTATPTDILADGGGITLKGDTDKTILYSETDDRWESNIPLNAPQLFVGGEEVGTATVLPLTLVSGSWTGSEAPYTQDLTFTGMKATDFPFADLNLGDTTYNSGAGIVYPDDVEAISGAWGLIYRGVTTTDTVTFYANDIPEVDIPIIVRK